MLPRVRSRRKMHFYFAASSLALLVAGCSTTIHGVVRDKPTGSPVASASVGVGKNNARTNEIGAYELTCDVEPDAELIVNAPGYFLYTESVGKRESEGRDLVRDVELVPKTEGHGETAR